MPRSVYEYQGIIVFLTHDQPLQSHGFARRRQGLERRGEGSERVCPAEVWICELCLEPLRMNDMSIALSMYKMPMRYACTYKMFHVCMQNVCHAFLIVIDECNDD